MPSIYEHELDSYRTEVEAIDRRIQEITQPGAVPNVTHAALGVSNRSSLIVVGLCALAEARLLELAEEYGLSGRYASNDKIADALKRVDVDVRQLRTWPEYKNVCQIRNRITHSYGGFIIDETDIRLLREALKRLKLDPGVLLMGGHRLRLNSGALVIMIDVITRFIDEINDIKPSEIDMESDNSANMARELMTMAANSITEANLRFSAWLMAGLGAAFALLVSNIGSVSGYIAITSIKAAGWYFISALIAGGAQRLLALQVTGAARAAERGSEIGSRFQEGVNFDKVLELMEAGIWYPAKWLFKLLAKKDPAFVGRFFMKNAQCQAYLLLIQVILSLLLIYELIEGLSYTPRP